MNDTLFPGHRPPAVRDAVRALAGADATERGAVYTKPEIVTAMLDLVGYTPDRPLHRLRALEPCFGGGDFLLAMLDRLLTAFVAHGGAPSRVREIEDALRGVEVHQDAFEGTRAAVVAALSRWGADAAEASWVVDRWLKQDDFLLWPGAQEVDFVVGNPPYVRQERIPGPLLEEYRRRYHTLYDRADLYVPFFERGLDLLARGGRLAYICANRWLKNKYGGPLREHASSGFHLRYFIDLEGATAFHSEVMAYPAITVFERGSLGGTRVARRPEVSDVSLGRLVEAMVGGGAALDARVEELPPGPLGQAPWLLDAPERDRKSVV